MANDSLNPITLLPCPFCGAVCTREKDYPHGKTIQCLNCDAEGPDGVGSERAKEEWNTRIDDSLPYESQKIAYQAGLEDGKALKPVSVSLSKCANELYAMRRNLEIRTCRAFAKAVLDAAGISYVD